VENIFWPQQLVSQKDDYSVPTFCTARRVHELRVPRLPIRDCARGCNNRAQMCAQLNAMDVTARTFLKRLYLVLGLRKIAPWVNCSYAATTWSFTAQLFLDFCAIFSPNGPSIFSLHDSPRNLAESRYPPGTAQEAPTRGRKLRPDLMKLENLVCNRFFWRMDLIVRGVSGCYL